jgi:hypothetical protein
VLVGDPEKPGLYIVINKWLAGNNFSRPHFHPNDRFITVLKGTWWVGTGNKFDPANTVPMQVPSSPISASRCTGMAPRTRTRFSLLWARAPRQARGWKKRSSRFFHCSAALTRSPSRRTLPKQVAAPAQVSSWHFSAIHRCSLHGRFR